MKKPAGYTGPYSEPNSLVANGVFVSPIEIYSLSLLNQWPSINLAREAGCIPGEIIMVTATGVVNAVNQASPGSLVIASGGLLNRTTASGLFSATSGVFGAGDGSTTFNVINIPPNFSYLAGQTATSTPQFPQEFQASGVIPSHTHTVSSCSGVVGVFGNFGIPGGGPNVRSFQLLSTKSNSNSSDKKINEGKHQQIIYCVVIKNISTIPVGTIVLNGVPNQNYSSNSLYVPETYLVPSGQAISRSTYSILFNRIGTTYGSGNGTTTFNVPDFAGLFLRGSSASDYITISGNNVGSSGFISDSLAEHVHTVSTLTLTSPAFFVPGGGSPGVPPTSPGNIASSTSDIGSFETRPNNINMLYYIVASGVN